MQINENNTCLELDKKEYCYRVSAFCDVPFYRYRRLYQKEPNPESCSVKICYLYVNRLPVVIGRMWLAVFYESFVCGSLDQKYHKQNTKEYEWESYESHNSVNGIFRPTDPSVPAFSYKVIFHYTRIDGPHQYGGYFSVWMRIGKTRFVFNFPKRGRRKMILDHKKIWDKIMERYSMRVMEIAYEF